MFEPWLNSSKIPSERKPIIRRTTCAVTLDTMWSQRQRRRSSVALMVGIDPLALGGFQLNAIDVDQRLAATFIEQKL